ncbi:MAG: hypothetical protein ACYSTX_04580 [Planctomycetota bacterium]|jgi:hypothetical protein
MNSQQKILTVITLFVISLVVTPAFAHSTYSYTPAGILVPDSHAHSEQQARQTPGPLEGASELAGGAVKLVADTAGGIFDAVGGLFKADNKAAKG